MTALGNQSTSTTRTNLTTSQGICCCCLFLESLSLFDFGRFTSFSDHPVEYHGRSYRTAEHLFQALKFMDTNPALAERIRMLPTARMAQQEAKKQIRHQRVDWLEVNVAMMEKVLEAKFKQHRHLRNLLRSTGSRELIEDSPIDWFWGIGSDGHGRNELGKALVRLRERLQARRRH
ncbi:DUF1768-domain-containing protein [Lactarius pseudohatsudake]|nr:DUF1768-domain-containing protein [Lactarius pseudohatsudake]